MLCKLQIYSPLNHVVGSQLAEESKDLMKTGAISVTRSVTAPNVFPKDKVCSSVMGQAPL